MKKREEIRTHPRPNLNLPKPELLLLIKQQQHNGLIERHREPLRAFGETRLERRGAEGVVPFERAAFVFGFIVGRERG